jgi:iron complex outermembrane receptor protein
MLKGNIGRYYRAPSFYELFGDKGWVIGNTNLKPEAGLNRDVGFRIEGTSQMGFAGFLELSYYANNLEDMIQFIQFSQKVSRPENIGVAHVRGVELTAGCTVFNHLQLDVAYTHQKAINQTELYGGIYKGNYLPNKPKHTFSGRIEPFHRSYGRVFYEYIFSSANFRDQYNKVRVPERTIHNVGATVYLVSGKVHLTIEGKNLTDNQVADLWGYPLPGRSYYATVRTGF